MTNITETLRAARACIQQDRTSLADSGMRPDNTMDPDTAAGVAEYDAVLAQIDGALASMTTPESLPPLPEPYCVHHRLDRSGSTGYFSADQMRAYALEAIASLPVAESVFAAMPDFLTDTDVARIYRRIYPGSVRWHPEEREFAAEIEALVRARFAELAAPIKKEQEA